MNDTCALAVADAVAAGGAGATAPGVRADGAAGMAGVVDTEVCACPAALPPALPLPPPLPPPLATTTAALLASVPAAAAAAAAVVLVAAILRHEAAGC